MVASISADGGTVIEVLLGAQLFTEFCQALKGFFLTIGGFLDVEGTISRVLKNSEF